LTPLGLDTLKRQLDDFYSKSKNSRSLVANLRDGVKKLIVDKVPEYADMTKGYTEATELIDELEHTLSLGKKPMIDTTMRKLTSTMRDNFTFRTELLHQLQNATGENLESAIAGYNLSSMAPQGGFGKLTSGSLTAGMLAHVLSPHYLAILAMSSPRIVGESLRALGIGARYVNRIKAKLPQIKQYVKSNETLTSGSGKAAAGGLAETATEQNQEGMVEGGMMPPVSQGYNEGGMILPAVKIKDKIHEGKFEDPHADILKEKKIGKRQPHEEGFSIGGKFHNRKESSEYMKSQGYDVPDELHSGEMRKAINDSQQRKTKEETKVNEHLSKRKEQRK